MLAAVACAAVLHGASDRSAAARVVPIALGWGALVVWLTRGRAQLSVWVVVAAALAVRLPLVGTPPLLSDDLFRYLWEGLALHAGHNPFVEAPATIAGLDDALRDRVNHGEIPSIYPPLALLWFRALHLAGGTTEIAQAMAVLADITIPASILVATRRPSLAWLYALHPLPVLESAVGAHIDVPAVALAALGIALLRTGHPSGAWFATVGGALTKLLPALWLPSLGRERGSRTVMVWVVGAALLGLLLAAPVLAAGPALLDAFGTYTRSWAFNGLAYPWLEPVLGSAARLPLMAIGALATAWAWWRLRDPVAVWAVVGTTFVLTSPTVHPWYVLWALVPTLLLGSRAWALASVPLLASYTVLWAYDPVTGAWSESPWLWWITWPPAVLLLGFAYALRSDWSPTEPYPNANSARNGSDAA